MFLYLLELMLQSKSIIQSQVFFTDYIERKDNYTIPNFKALFCPNISISWSCEYISQVFSGDHVLGWVEFSIITPSWTFQNIRKNTNDECQDTEQCNRMKSLYPTTDTHVSLIKWETLRVNQHGPMTRDANIFRKGIIWSKEILC